jgi:predicted transcriptional regulator
VLQFWLMSHTITIRVSKELALWLDQVSAKTGVAKGKIIREHLERARAQPAQRSFMRLAGSVEGAPSLSKRKGFSRA